MEVTHLLTLLSLGLLTVGVGGLRVLILHPLYGGSHVLTLQSVTEELLSRGHKVTTVKFFDKNLPPLRTAGHANFSLVEFSINNTEANLPFVKKGEEVSQFQLPLDAIWGSGQNLIWTLKMIVDGAAPLQDIFCSNILGADLRHSLTLDPQKYDIALVDLMFNECGLALARDLGAPAIGYWAFSFTSAQQEYTTQPAPPSFIPAFMTGLSNRMNLLERTLNMLGRFAQKIFMIYYHSVQDKLISKYQPNSPLSSELIGNLSGMLINTDMILDYARPQPPTFINIGGIQVKDNPGMLPEHIRSFMEGAKEGVVLFTMGFIFDSTAVPKSMITNLFSAFSRLPQRVIFKYNVLDDGESPDMDVPSNVLVLPWVPQQAVLAHPATKVFVTHCGMHGVLEAIYHRVPMVGMPVFIDQGDVMTRMEGKGIGLRLDKGAESELIYRAIVKVRDDPSYKRNITALARLMRDRRSNPMEDAVWLVEYVARTRGAEHLKIGSRHLGLFQYYSIDVFLVLSTLFLLVVNLLSRFVPRFIKNCFFSTKIKML